MAAQAFTASPTTSFNATAALAVSVAVSFAAYPITVFNATPPQLTGRSMAFSANPITSFTATAILFGAAGGSFSFSPFTSFQASANLTGASDTRGVSVCDVIGDILAMWGIFCRKGAPDFAIARALSDLNQSMQLVWNNAEGRTYWTNATLTITLADAESSQDLGDDIQNVVGPCRRSDNKRPLTALGSLGELETFEDYYLDGETSDEPIAYHIDRLAQTAEDPARCVFHVTPAVSGASIDFLLEVVKESPRYTTDDLISCPLVSIPHKYVESLLLPIARYHASTFHLFRKPDLKPTIEREYQQAMISLGLADPLPGNAGDNKNKREVAK